MSSPTLGMEATTDVTEAVDLLRHAAQKMLVESEYKSFQHRVAKRLSKNGGQNPIILMQAWSRLLIEMALWIEAQQVARILSDEDIIGIMELHIDVARTYLVEKDAVPA